MGTVMDMDMLMVTHTEVMDMEDRVSPGTTFLKATLLASEFSHLMALRWERTCFLRTYQEISVLYSYQFLFFFSQSVLQRRSRVQKKKKRRQGG